MPKLLSPNQLLNFITIPQLVLVVYLLCYHLQTQTAPSPPLSALFFLQALWNVYLLIIYYKNKLAEYLYPRQLQIALPTFILIFSITLVLMFREYVPYFGISPEVVYLFLGAVSLCYLSLALSKEADEENLDLKKQAVICLVLPIAIALITGLNIYSYPLNSVFLIVAVGLFCGFTFFSGRLLYLFLMHKKNKAQAPAEVNVENDMSASYRFLVILVAIIIPLGGLGLNNYFFSDQQSAGLFGNFTSKWFYIIAVANGLLMLINTKRDHLSLAVFYLKVVGFTYILYFTLIFIPIIPLGVCTLVIFGVGIFAFAPLAVFLTELLQLKRDIRKLWPKFGLGIILAAGLGLITLPTILTANFYLDRLNFTNALTYLRGQPGQNPDVNLDRLQTSLCHVRAVLNTTQAAGVFWSGNIIPIITPLYQKIAMADKMISSDTAAEMSLIFFRTDTAFSTDSRWPPTQNVQLRDVRTQTEFDGKNGVYRTWVELVIRNDSQQSLSEYQTTFTLPEGCFIKDYYLYVGNQKKSGILADKRAALITYSNIIRTTKDPGIIYYKNKDLLELRVYPFTAGETRVTGFLVLHSQAETLQIDGRDILLRTENAKNTENASFAPLDMPGVSFIPANYKKALPQINRSAKYYFLLDAGQNSAYDEQLRKAQDFIQKHNLGNTALYNVSYQVRPFEEGNVTPKGGLNLPLAVKTLSQDLKEGEFPIIITVTDNMGKAPALESSYLTKLYPESKYYYNLGYDLSLTPYTLSGNTRQDPVEIPLVQNALLYKGGIVANDERSETVRTGPLGSYTDNVYTNAFLLQQRALDSNGSDIIRDSFRQKTLTRHTAFSVLETAEQENTLLDLQENFLNGKQTDAPAVMGEPILPICLTLALLFCIYHKYKQNTA